MASWRSTPDRKSVVWGKSVDLGGRRIIKKKKTRGASSPMCSRSSSWSRARTRFQKPGAKRAPTLLGPSWTSERLRGRSPFFFFQAEDGIRDYKVTGVQMCALPIYSLFLLISPQGRCWRCWGKRRCKRWIWLRSEEHTSELQSPCNLVCRLLLE